MTVASLNQITGERVGASNHLPEDLLREIDSFLPRDGALPPANREWNRVGQSDKSRFTKKDKENLDFIAVFRALSPSCPKVREYLERRPIRDAHLQDKQRVETIVDQVRTWMRATPNYGRNQWREPYKLDLSRRKLHTLPPFLASLNDCEQIDLSYNRFTDLSFMKQLPPDIQRVYFYSNPIKRTTKVTLFLQRTLLVLSTIAAILCVIPPIRLAGSLTLRSLSCLSSLLTAKNSFEHEGRFSGVLKCVKIATAILGLVGLILSQPYLIVVGLAVDIALQLFECVRGAIQGNLVKVLFHLGFAILNGLILAALLSGLWPIVVAAAALSAAFMAVMAIHALCYGYTLECICQLILMGVGIGAAIASAEMKYTDNYHYEYTNNTGNKVLLRDTKGHEWMLEPGESITLDLSTRLRLQLPFENPQWLDPVSTHETFVQQPIPYSDFPTLPAGSPSIENFSIPFKPWTRP